MGAASQGFVTGMSYKQALGEPGRGLLVQGDKVLLHLREGHHDAVDGVTGRRAVELRADGIPMTLCLGDGLDACVATEKDAAIAEATCLDGGVDRALLRLAATGLLALADL